MKASSFNYEIAELCKGMIIDYAYKRPCRKDFGSLIYVSHVAKSKTNKSVHQFSIESNYHNSEYFNLPEQFRGKVFDSIVAQKQGPYSKKSVGNNLIDVDPWDAYKVIYTGSVFECIFFITKLMVESFIFEQMQNLILSNIDEPELVDMIYCETSEDLIEIQIRTIVSDIYAKWKAQYFLELSKEDYSEWEEMGNDEERKMDDETNGYWRWNID